MFCLFSVAFQVYCKTTGLEHIRGWHGDVLCLRSNRIWKDPHDGGRVPRKDTRLQERHLRFGHQGRIQILELAEIQTAEASSLLQLLRNLQWQGN